MMIIVPSRVSVTANAQHQTAVAAAQFDFIYQHLHVGVQSYLENF